MTRGLSAVDRRFASVLGLGVALLIARIVVIFAIRGFQPITWTELPFFFRYDALVIVTLLWVACWSTAVSTRARRAQTASLWIAGVLLIVSTGVDFLARRELHVPVTYRLFVISDHLRGLHGATGGLMMTLLVFIAGAALVTAGIAASLVRLPRALITLRGWFLSWPAILLFITPLALVELWTQQHPKYPGVGANALWTFMTSFREELDRPLLAGALGDDRDFVSVTGPLSRGPLVRSPIGHDRPLNVVLIVMESVGAKWLGLYGAPYQNSLEMERLADRGAVFDRAYVSAPHTSSAMAALFCSVYPLHALRTITRVYPDLQIQGLPAVLAAHGYRTALVFGGNLAFDGQNEFLKTRGFAEVIDDSTLGSFGVTSEDPTLDPGLKWLGAAGSQPFFLTLWTIQTHFPYPNDATVDFGTNNDRHEKYLNGIRATDHLIGEVVRAVDRLGLTSNTMFIVTGDHGETFGLHGNIVHGFEIYNEEVWTPLIIAAPGIERQHVTTPVRQIDLAPTILGILGYPAPAGWQGLDLTAQNPPSRMYLFTGWRDFTLGVVENDRKAIFHYPVGSSELYDLRSDPNEMRNLADSPGQAAELALSRQHIEAWIAFQNAYLGRFKPAHDDE